jgi:class 3 adenylate cyclase
MDASGGLAVTARGDGVVTVLFTDIVASTQLLGLLGEEAMERCRREHFALLRQALAAHRGREIKNVGDGLMVAFARASDALACAIAMQVAVSGQQLPGEHAMLMRVGLHRGPTIEAEGDHWGTTVVVARRLCDLAQPREILTTPACAAAAKAEPALVRDLGLMSLRGLAEPARVCAMQWDGAPPARAVVAETVRVELPEALRRASGFVGRVAELDDLRACWEAAAAGERRLLLVAGEPGIGKSSLVAELGRRVHASGAIVLYGRCDEGIAVPFQPVAEALRQLVAALPTPILRMQLGGWAPDLARLLPEIAGRLGGGAPRSSSDPDADQHLMVQAVSQLLATTARGAPILLVAEDLHWADAMTVALLRSLAGAQPAAPLAIVATVRDEELAAGHPLHPAAAEPVPRLSLAGLGASEVAAMIEADGGRPPDSALAQTVHARTAGNPLHAAELARAWTQAGAIVVRDRALALAGGAAPGREESDIATVIGRRVSELPAEARRVLTLGSVFGRRFSGAVLERILAADEPGDLRSALGLAVDERVLVRADDDDAYAFAHALLRHALYARIGTVRRTRLHRQVGEVIEEDGAGEHLPELAYHFARCAGDGRVEKAVEYALRAGDESLRMLAHDRAAVHFAAALELLATHDVPGAGALRCDATIGLGESQLRAGDVAHRETLLDAARQAERLGDGDRLARAALANSRGFFSVVGRTDEERVAMLRAALAAAGGGDRLPRARLLALLAMETVYDGDLRTRARLSDEAVAMARRLEDPATLVAVLYQRSVALWGVHGHERRCRAVAEAEPLLDGLADPSLAFHISHQGVHTALEAGDMALADRRLAAMHDHAVTCGQPTLAWYEGVARAKRAFIAGRVQESEQLACEAVQIGVASGQPDAELWYAGHVFAARLAEGRQDEDDYDDMPAIMAAFPTLRTLLEAQLACLQAAHGEREDARETLARLLANGLDDVPLDFGWLATVALAGYACWLCSDAEHAETVAAVLAPWAEHFVDLGPTWLGSASLYLALLAITRGRPREAHAHFARATAMHERCGARALQAHVCVAWAELLAGGDIDDDDAPAPAALAGEALAVAAELELPGVERDARRVLSRLAGARA